MKVYLLSYTSLADGMNQFLADKGMQWVNSQVASEAELLTEAAGRVCYMSFGRAQFHQTTRSYIGNLINNGHESVLEHASYTILIDGLSRALSHQLVRHRIGFSYSQLSQQYHDESGCEFIEPEWHDGEEHLKERWRRWEAETHKLYIEMLGSANNPAVDSKLSPKEKNRRARSVARSVLPNSTKTTLVITGNVRAWRNMLDVRGAIPGDFEMREYCSKVYEMLSSASPDLFADFEILTDEFGPLIRRRGAPIKLQP